MPIINELTLVSILTLLARKYPDGVEGEKIVKALGVKRKDDLRRSIYYLKDKGYIMSEEVPSKRAASLKLRKDILDSFVVGRPRFRIEDYVYRLTTKGVEYLDVYNRKLAETLEEIKRGEPGFKV